MNRRTALMLSMFLGGLIPRGLWAQTAAPQVAENARQGTTAGVSQRRPRRCRRATLQ